MAIRNMITGFATLLILGLLGYLVFLEIGPAKGGAGEKQPAPAANSTKQAAAPALTQSREELLAEVERCKRAIEREPGKIANYCQLGKTYLFLGQAADAEKVLTEALGRCDKASSSGKPEDIEDAVRVRTILGNVMLAKADFAKAQRLLEEAVKLSPRDAAAHSDLATALFIQGKYDGAATHYDLATVLDPTNPEPFCNWGTMLYQAERISEAEAKFRKAISLKKDNAKYHYWLGRALRKEGRFGPALKAQEDALRINPKMLEALLETGSIYVELKQFKPAETWFRAALSVDRDNLEATVNLAHVMLGTDDPQQRNCLDAVLLLRKATELTREQDVNLLTQLSDAYALAEVFDQADETLKKAMAVAKAQHLSDVDMELLLQRGQEYMFMQNNKSAKPEGKSALNVTGDGAIFPLPQSASPYDLPQTKPVKLPEPRVIPAP